jgi:hypothetical protein
MWVGQLLATPCQIGGGDLTVHAASEDVFLE